MRIEQTFVVPLSLREAQRLADELERLTPRLPGFRLRVTLEGRGETSTAVHVSGDLTTGATAGGGLGGLPGGLRGAVVADVAARFVRQFVRTMAERASAQRAAAQQRDAQLKTERDKPRTDPLTATGGSPSIAAAPGAATGGPASPAAQPSTGQDGARPALRRPRRRTPAYPADVWSAVTDPIAGNGGRPRRLRVRRTLPGGLMPRDLAAVAGTAIAVSALRRVLRRSQRRARLRSGPGPGGSE